MRMWRPTLLLSTAALVLWLFALLVWIVLIYFSFAVLTFLNSARGVDVIQGAWLNAIVGTQSLVVLGGLVAPVTGDFGGSESSFIAGAFVGGDSDGGATNLSGCSSDFAGAADGAEVSGFGDSACGGTDSDFDASVSDAGAATVAMAATDGLRHRRIAPMCGPAIKDRPAVRRKR